MQSEGNIELIVPILKGTSHASTRGQPFDLAPEDSPVAQAFAADILVLYALNFPDRLQYITQRDLANIGMSVAQLHAKAIENIPRHITEIKLQDLGGGMYGVTCGGTMEASLLLLEPIWEQLTSALPGIPLAAAPARDLLCIIGSKQPNSLSRIKQAASINLADPNLEISRTVLSRENGKWDKCRL